MTVFDRFEPPFFTCEAVITETSFLLSRNRIEPDALLGLLADHHLQIPFRLDTESQAIRTLIQRYRTIPMSLADACIVRMSELLPDAVVLSLDSDFTIYRRHRNEPIPVLMPNLQ